jgi:hypothetical protein
MDELLCPCLVVIPLDYNPDDDGNVLPVGPETMAEIAGWFNRQFEGWRQIGQTGVGTWRGQVDRFMTVVVALPENRIAEFETIVRAIGVKLRQESMYYEIGKPIARIMFMDAEAGSAAEGG